jgi:phage tail-like protein
LALTDDALFVADSGGARVQSFALPRLEANVAWPAGSQPASLTVDSRQRVLVIDAATGHVHRFSPIGIADTVFDNTIAAQGKLQKPLFVTCDAGDRVLISDAQANAVFVFDDTGSFVLTISWPAGWQPGALVVFGPRIFVADAATGAILIFEQNGSAWQLIAEVNGWRGPVTALAVNAQGDLLIKPSLDATFYQFTADVAYVPQGILIGGPFDAGEEREWECAQVDASLPPATSLAVRVVLKETASAPASTDWITLPSHDVLLSGQTANIRRFIWIELRLTTSSPQQSPRVQQARAATAAEDLRDYLPLTYRRNDENADGFLARWLKLVRGEFSRIEELLDNMPRLTDAKFAAASALPWLARWLSLELPQIADDEERRALVARAVQLFARRGTTRSIAEFVELHTGIKPAIVEAFADRRVWVLGETSRLDFDTRLPVLDPLGMVVPDESAGDGCCPQDNAADSSGCTRCSHQTSELLPAPVMVQTPIGRAIVGESGPLSAYQIGLPLYADTAYRFCVVVDGYRAHDNATRTEIARIVDRERPAHTDYRIEYIAPEIRVGLQARIGIDAIVGGDPPPLGLNPAELGFDTQLPPSDVARVGEATLDGLLTLT